MKKIQKTLIKFQKLKYVKKCHNFDQNVLSECFKLKTIQIVQEYSIEF